MKNIKFDMENIYYGYSCFYKIKNKIELFCVAHIFIMNSNII